MLCEGCADGGSLQRPEVLLAVVDEHFGDRLTGAGDDVGVDVAETDAQPLRSETADGGLAGAWRADQDEDRLHRIDSDFR
jgi:hypothetical protein